MITHQSAPSISPCKHLEASHTITTGSGKNKKTKAIVTHTSFQHITCGTGLVHTSNDESEDGKSWLMRVGLAKGAMVGDEIGKYDMLCLCHAQYK